MPVTLNGSSYFDITTKSALNNVSAATVAMWVYPTTGSSEVWLDFSRGGSTSSRFEMLYNGSSWQIGGRALDSDSFSFIQLSLGNYANNEHFVVTAIDFANATGYIWVIDSVNGFNSTSGSMTSMTAGNTSSTDSQAATVFSQPGGSSIATGDAADVCMWTRLLTTAEVQSMYTCRNAGSTVLPQSLVHRWRLREKHPTSTAGTIIDEGSIGSATSITGTLTYSGRALP